MSGIERHIALARRHAQHRAWQRFGIALNEGEMKRLEASLIAGEFRWVADLRGFCMAFEAPVHGKLTYPVFNGRLWAVVTFLPCEAWACRFAIRSCRDE